MLIHYEFESPAISCARGTPADVEGPGPSQRDAFEAPVVGFAQGVAAVPPTGLSLLFIPPCIISLSITHSGNRVFPNRIKRRRKTRPMHTVLAPKKNTTDPHFDINSPLDRVYKQRQYFLNVFRIAKLITKPWRK